MVTTEEVREAEQLLAGIPEYGWLVGSNHPWWTAASVAPYLGVSKDVVRTWCERGEIEGAVLYAQQVGWRIPRSSLVVFCAKKQGWQPRQHNQQAG